MVIAPRSRAVVLLLALFCALAQALPREPIMNAKPSRSLPLSRVCQAFHVIADSTRHMVVGSARAVAVRQEPVKAVAVRRAGCGCPLCKLPANKCVQGCQCAACLAQHASGCDCARCSGGH